MDIQRCICETMDFAHSIEDLSTKYKTRKDNIKSTILKQGYLENEDFILCYPKYADKNKKGVRIDMFVTDKVARHMDLYYAVNKRNLSTIECDVELHCVRRFLPKEIEIIGFIYDVLEPLYNVVKEYRVSSYRIDLYIVDKRIAIECDEYGHDGYRVKNERMRQEFITKELSCKFLRFNPDAPDFKLSALMTRVLQMCLSSDV